MPRYKVVHSPTFVTGSMVPPGEVVEFAGWPGSTLEPADEVARRIKEYFGKHRGSKTLPRSPVLSDFVEAMPVPPEKSKAHLFKKVDKTDG